ncbi:hypothetical protein B0T13DRAFT_486341 [Neurospora crassa]|nr:hypothetical protein B0T13DRAFT_486341 [Neurospora crassa]
MWMEARDIPSLNSFATKCPYNGNVTSKSVIYVTASTGALDPVHQPWGTSHRSHGIRHAKDLPGR